MSKLTRRDEWRYEYMPQTYLDTILELVVTKQISEAFHIKNFHLLSSIPSTGRALLWATIPKGKEYPLTPPEIRDIITHNMGQSRIETFPRHPRLGGMDYLPSVIPTGIYVIDGVFMYASCLSRLPIGKVIWDRENSFEVTRLSNGMFYPSCPGFYRLETTVPFGWKHIGLVQSERGKGSLAHATGIYPRFGGDTFTNWVTANEVALLANNGWYIEIKERIIWPDTNNITDPLATWREKLVDLWRNAKTKEQKSFYRDLVIQTVGSFHQKVIYNEHVTPRSELPLKVVPAKVGALDKDGLHWWEEVPIPKSREPFIRPEWSATIWGRARTRLASYALTLPFDAIISLRSDSIWTTAMEILAYNSSWEDTPGAFRVKDYIKGPIEWPESAAKMRTMVVARNKELKEKHEKD